MRPNTIKHSWCCANNLLRAWTKMEQNVLLYILCIVDALRPGQNGWRFAGTQYTLQIIGKKNMEVSSYWNSSKFKICFRPFKIHFRKALGQECQPRALTSDWAWVNEVSRHLIFKRSSFDWMIRCQFSHPGNSCHRNMPCIITMVIEKGEILGQLR